MNYFQQVLSVVPTCPFLYFRVVLREPWIWVTHTAPEDSLFRHNITIPNRCAGKQVLTRLAGTAGNCQDQHTGKQTHLHLLHCSYPVSFSINSRYTDLLCTTIPMPLLPTYHTIRICGRFDFLCLSSCLFRGKRRGGATSSP